MEENLLLRRFIFFQKDEHFDESVQSFLLENNPEAIVFIADTKTIWTHGVRFNASAVRDYAEGINDRVDEINTSVQNLHEDISGELLDILNQWGGPEELNLAIDDANDRLATAEEKIKYLQNNPYKSTEDAELLGLIRNEITGATNGLVLWKESLYADNGLFSKIVTYDNIVDKTSTIYRQILDIVEAAYTQQIEKTNVDGKVRAAVTEQMQIYMNGDTYYKNVIQQWKEGLENSITTRLSILDGIDSWQAKVTRNSGDIKAILSALDLEIDKNNNPSWQLTAATDGKSNPIIAAIKGWVENNKSNILVDADNITFNGEHTSFNKTVMDIVGKTYWKGNNDDILTLVNNAGIKITNNDNSIELKLPVGDSSWQGGLRHIKDDGETINEGSFVLNIDGSGHIGGKMKSGEYPVVWDEDGNLFINANTITTKTDPNNNNDNENGVIDFNKVGGYTIRVYTTSKKSSPITPIQPSINQTLSDGVDKIYINGWTWYRMLSAANATDKDNIWMSTREVNKDGSIILKDGAPDRNYIWSDPILLTAKDGKDGQDGLPGPQGPDGKPGEDGVAIKRVFIHSKTQTLAKDASDANVDYKYVPNPPDKVLRDVDYQNTVGNGWVDDAFQEAASLNDTYQYVWTSFSNTIEKTTNGLEYYTNWSDPVIWSRWGRNGTDGGGVEYIFYQGPATKNWDVAGAENPVSWINTDGTAFLLDLYIKPAFANVWMLDPKNITVQGNANWVSIRKLTKNSDGKLVWGSYSPPTIWSYFAIDGKAEAAYTMDWTNDQLVVSVDEDGHVSGTSNGTGYDGFTGYSKMQVWDPNGTAVKCLNDAEAGEDYFKLGDSSIEDFAGARPQGQNWYDYKYGSFSQGTFTEVNGDWIKIHMIDYDQYTNSQSLDPAFRYTEPWNLKNKHLYIPVTVTIYDGTNHTPKYARDIMMSIFGVYTGVDGAAGAPGRSIELKTSTNYVKKDSSNQITPSSIDVWAIIGEGSNDIDRKDPGDTTFTFDYKDNDDDNYTQLNTGGKIYTANITSYPLEVRLLYNGTVIDTETIQLIENGQDGQDGQRGADGQSTMYSYIYTRTNQIGLVSPSLKYMETNDLTGTLGTFLNPNPTGDYAKVYRYDPTLAAYVEIEGAKWYDSIPYGSETLWESRAIFTSDGELPQVQYDEGAEDYLLWSTPAIVVDTDEIDIEFSSNETFTQELRLGDNETVDKKQAKGWYDPGTISALLWSTMVWRAERRKKNGHHVGSWMYMKIKGEKGDAGENGINGENGIFVYLDNLADLLPTNNLGITTSETILSTHVMMFDGQTSVQLGSGDDEFVISSASPLYGAAANIEAGGNTVSWTIANNTNLSNAVEKQTATISVRYKGVTYNAIFSVAISKAGADGNSILHQISVDKSQIIFNKTRSELDNSINYSPIDFGTKYSNVIALKIKKTSNEGTVFLNRLAGYKIICGYEGYDNTYETGISVGNIQNIPTNYVSFTSVNDNSQIFINIEPLRKNSTGPLYDLFFIELWKDGATVWEDRQTILITSTVLDGKNGANGTSVRLDLDNEQFNIACAKLYDGDGFITKNATLIELSARLYVDGLGQMVLNTDPNEDGCITVSNLSGTIVNIGVYLTIQFTPQINIYSAEDDKRANITITIPKDTIISAKQEMQVSVPYNGNVYSRKFVLLAIETDDSYEIYPMSTAIVLNPNDEDSLFDLYVKYKKSGVLMSFDENVPPYLYMRYVYFSQTTTLLGDWTTLESGDWNYTTIYAFDQDTHIKNNLKSIKLGLSLNEILNLNSATDDSFIDIEEIPVVWYGLNGKDGKDGQNGQPGQDGKDGQNGENGQDGKDAPYIEYSIEYLYNNIILTSENNNVIIPEDAVSFRIHKRIESEQIEDIVLDDSYIAMPVVKYMNNSLAVTRSGTTYTAGGGNNIYTKGEAYLYFYIRDLNNTLLTSEIIPLAVIGPSGSNTGIQIRDQYRLYKTTETKTTPAYSITTQSQIDALLWSDNSSFTSDGWTVLKGNNNNTPKTTLSSPYLWSYELVSYSNGGCTCTSISLVDTYFQGAQPNLLKNSGAYVSGNPGDILFDQSGIDLDPDTWYTLSVDTKNEYNDLFVDESTTGYIGLNITGANICSVGDKKYIDEYEYPIDNTSNGIYASIKRQTQFTLHTVRWKTTDTFTGKARLVIRNDGNIGTVEIKNVKLEKGTVATAYTEYSTDIMYYPAGVWNAATIYSRTSSLVPYVYYNEHYYILLNSTSSNETPGGANNAWELVSLMSSVITNAVITNYAKVGSAVFFGDYIYSQQGTSTGQNTWRDFDPTDLDEFSPNWYVNLATGKMVAAKGNFVANADGSVNIAKGNFVVSNTGDVTISGSLAKSTKGTIIDSSAIKNKFATIDLNDITAQTVKVSRGTEFTEEETFNNVKIIYLELNGELMGDIVFVDPERDGTYEGITILSLPDPGEYEDKKITVSCMGLTANKFVAVCCDATLTEQGGANYITWSSEKIRNPHFGSNSSGDNSLVDDAPEAVYMIRSNYSDQTIDGLFYNNIATRGGANGLETSLIDFYSVGSGENAKWYAMPKWL